VLNDDEFLSRRGHSFLQEEFPAPGVELPNSPKRKEQSGHEEITRGTWCEVLVARLSEHDPTSKYKVRAMRWLRRGEL